VAALCLCARLRPFETAARFCILMHPKESKVAIGTGRLAHHALIGSTLVVAEHVDEVPAVARLLADASLAPAVLFPRRDALDLARATPDEARAVFPAGRRPLVLVPDGTWTTAKKLVRLSARLAALPAIRFEPSAPARYDRLRKEPRPECRSTLEAIHETLERLHALGIAPTPGDDAHDHLLVLLDALVAEQARFEPEPACRDDGPGATRGPRV